MMCLYANTGQEKSGTDYEFIIDICSQNIKLNSCGKRLSFVQWEQLYELN